MDFTIRNLPGTVLDDLERAARLNGRSVNDEAIDRLESRGAGLSAPEPALGRDVNARRGEAVRRRRPVEQVLAEIEAMQLRHPLPELTPELLDELKREGRA